jgi:hypothetical protein
VGTGTLSIQGSQGAPYDNIALAPTSGNVGVGTSSPAYKLEIVDPSPRAYLKLSRGEGGGNGSADLILGNLNAWQIATDWEQNGSNDFFVYRSGPTPSIFFNASGNVGIGTTAPTAQLDVQARAAENKGIIIQAAASQTANLQEWQNSSGNIQASITPAGAFVGPLGMLISHGVFAGVVSISGTAGCSCTGTGTIYNAREGDIILRTQFTDFSSAEIFNAGGSDLGIDRPGTFFSARAKWVSPGGIKAAHVYTVSAGGITGSTGTGFGFKAVGATLNGVTHTSAGLLGTEVDVDLATTLTDFASVDLLAVRRASSVEFYVNGVLKGSITTNLPIGSDSGPLYELSVTNGAGNSTDAQVEVNMLTVGIPMF